MDTLHNQYLLVPQRNTLPGRNRTSLLEIELRQLHLLAGEQIIELGIKQLQVHCLQRLEIIIAVAVLRRMLAVDEIIVQFNDLRHHSEDTALQRKAQRRRRLSARRRTGDEHRLHLVAARINLIRDSRIFTLMKSLREIDQTHRIALGNGPVQCSYPIDPHYGTPVRICRQCGSDLRLRLHRNHLGEITLRRELKAKAISKRQQVEHFQITRRRKQRTMKGIYLTIKKIHTADKLAQRLLELRLVRLVVFLEQGLGSRSLDLFLDERHVGIHNLMHAFLDGHQIRITQPDRHTSPILTQLHVTDIAIQTARKGMVNDEHLVRKQFPDSILQDETKRAQIGAAPVRMIVTDKFHFMGHRQPIVELLQLMVHKCREHRIFHPGFLIRHSLADLIGKISEPLQERNLITLSVIDQKNIEFISLNHFIYHLLIFHQALLSDTAL